MNSDQRRKRDAQLTAFYNTPHSLVDTGAEFGLTPMGVSVLLKRRGVPRHRIGFNLKHKVSTARDDEVIAYYLAPNSLHETGAKFGLSHQGVQKVLIRNGVARRPRGHHSHIALLRGADLVGNNNNAAA